MNGMRRTSKMERGRLLTNAEDKRKAKDRGLGRSTRHGCNGNHAGSENVFFRDRTLSAKASNCSWTNYLVHYYRSQKVKAGIGIGAGVPYHNVVTDADPLAQVLYLVFPIKP
jgi:hypothetical protein